MAGRGGCDRTTAAACAGVSADLPNCKRPSQRILYQRTRSRDAHPNRTTNLICGISPLACRLAVATKSLSCSHECRNRLPPDSRREALSLFQILPTVSAEMRMPGIAMMAPRTVQPPSATPQNQHDRQHHADRKTKEPGEWRCIPRNHTTHSLAHRCRMTTVRRPRGKQGTGAGNRGKGAGLRVRGPAATPLASSRHSTARPSDELDARRIPLNAPAPRTSQ